MVKYLEQSPIIPVVLAGLMLILILTQSIVKKKFQFVRFVFSTLLTFCAVLILIFYEEISNSKKLFVNLTLGGMWFIDIVAILMLFGMLDLSFSNESFQAELKKTLDQTKLYVLLNKKDKVKEISSCFLKELGIKESQALNKNIFDVIELKYYLVGLNESGCLKADIKKYYNHYEKKVKPGDKRQVVLEMEDDHAMKLAMYFDESVIFSNSKYKGRILLGQKKTEESLIGLEKKELEAKNDLKIIKSRFYSVITKSIDGIFFHTLNKQSIWLNDVLVKKLFLNGNSLSTDEFFTNIHPDDLRIYKETIRDLKEGDYEISYRFNTGNYYLYIKEKGCKIVTEDTMELCGVMNVVDDNSFERTNTVLDDIKREDSLKNVLRELYTADRPYEVVHFRVSSIPQINEKYGREIGNMCLAQYVETFKSQFVDDNLIFRVGGLDFVCVLINYNSMEKLRSQLRNGEKILHGNLNYVSEKIPVDVNMGISMSNEGVTPQDVLKNAKECLVYCSNPKFTSSYLYYKDLK